MAPTIYATLQPKIRLSRHAQDKLLFSGLDENLIREVLEKSQNRLYDIAKGAEVAISEATLYGERIGLIVVFRREDGAYFIVTVYPAKKYQEEIRRKVKSGRWIPRTRG